MATVRLVWDAASASNPITNYRLYEGGNFIVEIGNLLTHDLGGVLDGVKSYTVRAKDSQGNIGPDSVAAVLVVASAFDPLLLGAKLLRWIHPNDGAQVVTSGSDVVSIADKGTVNDNAVAEDAPQILDGEITFDGANDALGFTTPTVSADTEIFLVVSSVGTFFGSTADMASAAHYTSWGLRDNGGVQTAEFREIAGSGADQLRSNNADLNHQMAVLGFRTTGGEYIMSVNGVDYQTIGGGGTNLILASGANSGDWFDAPSGIDGMFIGKLGTSSPIFYPGVLGKAGFIETAPLTTQERSDLVTWMMSESGV